MNRTRLVLLAALVIASAPRVCRALEESISLIPIEPSLFHHEPPTYEKLAYRFGTDGLRCLKGAWTAAAEGGEGEGAWASLGPAFEDEGASLRYAWDLRPGAHQRTRLVFQPGSFSRVRLEPGDGLYFRARSLGKELDNYPNRYVLRILVRDGGGRRYWFATDYFEVEGVWGGYYVPLERFADTTHGAIGLFAALQGPHVLEQVVFEPVTNKCRSSELLLHHVSVYTQGEPCRGDADGDGVPDPLDGDDDNDGVLDYAQKPGPSFTCPLEGYVLYGGRWKGRFTFHDRAPGYGDTLAVDAELVIRSEDLARAAGAFPEFVAVLVGERMFDASGRYRQFSDHMISTLLTPTGLPIENIQPGVPTRHFPGLGRPPVSSPIDVLARVRRDDVHVDGDTIRMRFSFRRLLDYSVPAGRYRFQFSMGVLDDRGNFYRFEELPSVIRSGGGLPQDAQFRQYVQPEESLVFVRKNYLPLIRVGRPEGQPLLPWALLFDVESHGVRGIVPEEAKGRWGLNFRNRLAGKPIYGPGWYNLEPGLPSLVYERLNIHHRMNFRAGEMQAWVKGPDGEQRYLGKAGFRTPTRWGASTRTGRFLHHFQDYGRYEVTLRGHLFDAWGNVYYGGGTYVLWIAERITFGTFPSLPYEVGQAFHGAVEVVPAVPADITLTLEHYPYSDPKRKVRFETGRKAFPYGLFVPPESYRFKEPGEYFSHIEGRYRDPHGRLWMGSLYGSCVVAPRDGPLVAHGRGWYMSNGQVLGDAPRYNLRSEGNLAHNVEQYLFYPYYTGDIMYVASSMDFKNEIYPLMTMEFRTACSSCGCSSFVRAEDGGAACAQCGGRSFYRPEPYGTPQSFDPKQVPVLSATRNGWSGHAHPEKLSHLAYFYTDAWRPGVSGRHVVGEGLMMNSYWPTSPSILGNQMHAGHNGDLPGDFYKFTGGIVYRDLRTGLSLYDIYASFGVVIPKGSNANRVVAFGEEPLFNILGRDHYLFLGGGVLPVPGLVLAEGGRVPAAGAVNPPVPAKLRTEVENPSGKVWSFEMQANRIGVCPRDPGNTAPLNEPGVWKARQKLSYRGRTGDVLGSGDGEYEFYVLPSDETRIVPLTVDQPPLFTFEPHDDLYLSGSAPESIVEGTVHYTLITPGLILDYGRRPLRGGRYFEYKYNAVEMSYCYPFLDTVNHMTGRPQLADTLVLTLFLEGRDAGGRTFYGVRMVTLRGNRVINLPPLR